MACGQGRLKKSWPPSITFSKRRSSVAHVRQRRAARQTWFPPVTAISRRKLQMWNRRHKPPAPSIDVLKLLHHFRLQIPRQNDDEVRLEVLELDFIGYGNAAAGHVLALLCRISVHYERNQIGPYPGIVHEGVTLGRSPIGGDGLALALSIQQKSKKIVLDLVGLRLETGIVAGSGHASLAFAFQ